MDTFVVCLFCVQPSLRVRCYSPAANSDSDWNIVAALSSKWILVFHPNVCCAGETLYLCHKQKNILFIWIEPLFFHLKGKQMGEILVNSLRCNVRVDKFSNTVQATVRGCQSFLFGKNSNNTILNTICFLLFFLGTRARMWTLKRWRLWVFLCIQKDKIIVIPCCCKRENKEKIL